MFSVQNAVRVNLHPAVARDPRGPIHLDVLGQRPEPPLQRIDTLLRRVRAEQGRNARKPSANVEVIYSRATSDPSSHQSLLNIGVPSNPRLSILTLAPTSKGLPARHE
jgi:hypothetical protein